MASGLEIVPTRTASVPGGDIGALVRQEMASLCDFTLLLPKLGEISMDSQKMNIEESRSPSGETYPPLKRKRRKGHNYGSKPLLDSTTMYQSLHVELRGADEVFAGPSLMDAPYFAYQNEGAPKAGIPPRTFIGIRSEDFGEWDGALGDHVTRALGGI